MAHRLKVAIPTLVDAPHAAHTVMIADYHKGQSLIETLMASGHPHVLLTDWKSATPYMAEIILAGDGNNVSYQNGNEVEPILVGNNNEVSVDTGLTAPPASTQAQSEPSSSNMSEAEREALEGLVNESASGRTSNGMSDEVLREAAEEALDESASGASSDMAEEALQEAAEEALNESGS